MTAGRGVMSVQPMEAYFRDLIQVEALGAEALRATVSFPPELQGPPDTGHGGGVTAMLFELLRLLVGEQGGEARIGRPLQIETAIHHAVPLGEPLRGEVARGEGGWVSRLLHGDRLVADATIRPAAGGLHGPSEAERLQWQAAMTEGFELPGYRYCLACGLENPRGVHARFTCGEALVWKRLVPRPHFACADGSLFHAFLTVVCDEMGWWLGALRQGECGLSNRVTVWLGGSVTAAGPLLVLGPRDTVTSTDPKGRLWQTRSLVVGPNWSPVAAAVVQFAGSRAFTKTMLPLFLPGDDPASLGRVFPRYRRSEDRSA
jgi:hypothetical protein